MNLSKVPPNSDEQTKVKAESEAESPNYLEGKGNTLEDVELARNFEDLFILIRFCFCCWSCFQNNFTVINVTGKFVKKKQLLSRKTPEVVRSLGKTETFVHSQTDLSAEVLHALTNVY